MQTNTTGTRNTPAKFNAGVEVLGAGRLPIEVGERHLAAAAARAFALACIFIAQAIPVACGSCVAR